MHRACGKHGQCEDLSRLSHLGNAVRKATANIVCDTGLVPRLRWRNNVAAAEPIACERRTRKLRAAYFVNLRPSSGVPTVLPLLRHFIWDSEFDKCGKEHDESQAPKRVPFLTDTTSRADRSDDRDRLRRDLRSG